MSTPRVLATRRVAYAHETAIGDPRRETPTARTLSIESTRRGVLQYAPTYRLTCATSYVHVAATWRIGFNCDGNQPTIQQSTGGRGSCRAILADAPLRIIPDCLSTVKPFRKRTSVFVVSGSKGASPSRKANHPMTSLNTVER